MYFGGGTPSLYPLNKLKSLIDYLPIGESTEITLEMDQSYADDLEDSLEKVYFKLVRNTANMHK